MPTFEETLLGLVERFPCIDKDACRLAFVASAETFHREFHVEGGFENHVHARLEVGTEAAGDVGGAGVHAFRQPAAHGVHFFRERGLEYLGLAVEVVVDAGLGLVCHSGNVLDRGLVVAVDGERL